MIYRKVAAWFAAAFLAVAAFVPSAEAANATPSFSFPLNSTTTQGVFNGTLRISSFAVQNNALVATGIVTGTMVTTTGQVTSVARTVVLPVVTGNAKGAKAIGCEILHLELGPLDLDLLGLVVHLDRVVLDLTAVPGAGNLLGNLLCAVTNLLNGGGPLAQIANLLNQILALLGVL